jgi:hypothetical protein
MMNYDNLARAKELLRDDERANGVDGATARIADDVGVALLQAEEPRRVQPGIHADHNGDFAAMLSATIVLHNLPTLCACEPSQMGLGNIPAWGHGQIALGELRGVLGICSLKLGSNGSSHVEMYI